MPSIADLLRLQQEHIDKVGWSVTAVMPTPDDLTPPFAYTVGMTEHGYPELIIAGLDAMTAHHLLNDMARRIFDRAERFTDGQHIHDLIAGYDAVLVDGAATEALHPGSTYARYGADRVRLQQIVWPDPHGHFPWDRDYTYDPTKQPLLARP